MKHNAAPRKFYYNTNTKSKALNSHTCTNPLPHLYQSSVRNKLSKQLVIRVSVLYHYLVVVARLTCIALICLSPVVSCLRFTCGLCGLSQERVLLHLAHVARLTCISLIFMSPVVSSLRFICGLCCLSEERVVILLRLQARLC